MCTFSNQTHTILIKNSTTLEDLILPLLPAVQGLFEIPCSVAASSDSETISFESIQLSTQGAERQVKDATWEKMVDSITYSHIDFLWFFHYGY